MKLHEISVRDPHHERDAKAQSAEIASWIAQHHPSVVVVPWTDPYGRFHVGVHHQEHETAFHIRNEVQTVFPSRPQTRSSAQAHPTHIPMKAARSKPAAQAKAKKASKPRECGFYVLFTGDKKNWQSHFYPGFSPPPNWCGTGIRSAQHIVKASKATGHATIAQVTAKGTIRKVESWTKARTLWHRDAAK